MGAGASDSFPRIHGVSAHVARGRIHNWRCRSGSRYLYICEDGWWHWCSAARVNPWISAIGRTQPEMPTGYSTKEVRRARGGNGFSCVQQWAYWITGRPQNLKANAHDAAACSHRGLVQIGQDAATPDFTWYFPSHVPFSVIFSPRTPKAEH